MLQRTIATMAALALFVMAGCNKETPKKGPPAAATPAPATPTPAPAVPVAAEPTPAGPVAAEPAQPAEPAPVAAEPAPVAAEPAAAPVKPANPEADAAEKARKEMEERRQKIQEIYTLGRSKEPGDMDKLKTIIVGDGPVYERASAIRALPREKRDELIPDLKKLNEDKNTAVKIEAAIKLYQWSEEAFALPVLKDLRNQGVALRRAFQTGYDKGKPTYDKNALAFFKDGVKNDNVYVQLDSAVGLIELAKEKDGIPVLKNVLEKEEKYHIRMAAVNYLTPLKTNEAVKGLLELATKDKDERVAKRAKDVLGIAAVPEPTPEPTAPAPAPAPGPADKPAEQPAPAPGK